MAQGVRFIRRAHDCLRKLLSLERESEFFVARTAVSCKLPSLKLVTFINLMVHILYKTKFHRVVVVYCFRFPCQTSSSARSNCLDFYHSPFLNELFTFFDCLLHLLKKVSRSCLVSTVPSAGTTTILIR
jgi:hypothetical protein